MPRDPKECRRHALVCMQISQSSPSPEARKHFADLARTWLRLAGDLKSTQPIIDLLSELREPERRAS
jgi:hypothetical protein